MSDFSAENTAQSDALPLQLAYHRALEMAQFQGGFLARTAHELRSPLNKIISLQQMIIEGLCDDPEEEREFVSETLAASLKLLEYLDFLIRVSKIELGRIVPAPQAVSLTEILGRVKDMTHLQVTDRNLRLEITPPSEDIQVWVDPTWLQNLLTTLIEVSLDSCDRGTIRLHMATETPPDLCCLLMEDDRPADCWQEPSQLDPQADFNLEKPLPSSLRMSLVQAMLTAMNGTLSLVNTADGQQETTTCLQIGLPLPSATDD